MMHTVEVEECLVALQKAKLELGEYFSDRKYDQWNKDNNKEFPASGTIALRLGGWNKAKQRVGLKIKSKSKNNIKKDKPQEFCLNALRKASEELGVNLSKKQYDKWQKNNKDYPTSRTIVKYFNDWIEAKEIVLKSINE